MSKFYTKIKQIEEALSFNKVFTAPDSDEKEKRQKELLDARLAEVNKTKLPDGTWHVHGDLDVGDLNLTSLEGLNVSIVDGYFDCSINQLTNLEGSPKEVEGSFQCSYNNLTSLKGCPKVINGRFNCRDNQLKSLEGCPIEVKSSFYCRENKKHFTHKEIRAVCKVGGYILS